MAGLSALALPAIAAAQQTSPTDAQYEDSLDFIAQGAGSSPSANRGAGSATSDPGGLPFTGLDVGLLAAVAAGLLIAGLVLRRTRPNSDPEAAPMNSAELSSAFAGRDRRRALRALEAQRMIDLLALRVAPAVAAGLIAYLHIGELGEGLIVFACVFVATQAIERSQLPLHVMPASRVLLGMLAPLVGAARGLVALARGRAVLSVLRILRDRARRVACHGPGYVGQSPFCGPFACPGCGDRIAGVRRGFRRRARGGERPHL